MYVSPEENLKICYGCGEIYDANVAFEILHHVTPTHEPLLPPRRGLRRPQKVMMLARAC